MSAEEGLVCRDLSITRTSATTGSSFVTRHRVWDSQRFVASQIAAEAQLKEQGKDFCFIAINNPV